MKWLKVYGLPKLPLFLARLAMRFGLPGPTWYKWKAASAGTGVILDEMIRAADDLGYEIDEAEVVYRGVCPDCAGARVDRST